MGCAAARQLGQQPGRASAHVGIRARQDLISSVLAMNLWGLRVSCAVDAKHDGEGGPARMRPLRHLLGALLSAGALHAPRPDDHRHRLGVRPGGSLPVATSPPHPSRRGVARGREDDEHRGGGYEKSRGHSTRERANTSAATASASTAWRASTWGPRRRARSRRGAQPRRGPRPARRPRHQRRARRGQRPRHQRRAPQASAAASRCVHLGTGDPAESGTHGARR